MFYTLDYELQHYLLFTEVVNLLNIKLRCTSTNPSIPLKRKKKVKHEENTEFHIFYFFSGM